MKVKSMNTSLNRIASLLLCVQQQQNSNWFVSWITFICLRSKQNLSFSFKRKVTSSRLRMFCFVWTVPQAFHSSRNFWERGWAELSQSGRTGRKKSHLDSYFVRHLGCGTLLGMKCAVYLCLLFLERIGTVLPCCLCHICMCVLIIFLYPSTWLIGWMQEKRMWGILLSSRVLLNCFGFAVPICFTSCEDRFSRQPNAITLYIELSFKYEVTWYLFPCCNWSLYFFCWVL